MNIEKMVTDDKVTARLKLFAIYFMVALGAWVEGIFITRLVFYLVFNGFISNEGIVMLCNFIALGFMIVASTSTYNFMNKHEKSKS